VRLVAKGGVFCSGTLIAGDRVLTARLCVLQRDVGGSVFNHVIPPNDIRVELGDDDLAAGDIEVRAIVSQQECEAAEPSDIAILVLSREVPNVSTMSVFQIRPGIVPEVHGEIVIWGFGRCDAFSPAHLGARHAYVRAVSNRRILASGQTCSGDSGAGAEYNGELVGVLTTNTDAPGAGNSTVAVFELTDAQSSIFALAEEVSRHSEQVDKRSPCSP
jgi:hypothetical protein